MTSRFLKGLALVAVGAVGVAMSGCGSDPGSGTETLFVTASARSDGSSGGTELAVTVRQGSSSGTCLEDATVIMTGDKGTEHALTYWGLGGCIGYYRKTDIAWEPGWRLRITRGADKLDAYIQAPGLTTITDPTAGFIFGRAAQQPLHVKWKDESGRTAQQVEVRLNHGDYNQNLSEDPGNRDIPYTAWGQAESQETVRVLRKNAINLNGGVAGSTFEAWTEDEVEFQVQ